MLIVGLGNPGEEYENTWHNLGRLAVETFGAANDAGSFKRNARIGGSIATFRCDDRTIHLMECDRFMNESGIPIAAALSFFKLSPKDLVVVHDELAFPVGTVRIATGSHSSGGHNGVQSVIDSIGTKDFVRVRIGIAPQDGRKVTMQSYVLKPFPKKERETVAWALADAAVALDKIVKVGATKAAQEVNSK